MKPLAHCRLYTFVDTAYLRGRTPESVATDLCAGGADLIQLRAKGMPAEQVAGIARSLLRVTEHEGVWLVINDHWKVACSVGAPLCHLGQEDFFDAGHQHVSELHGEPEVGSAGQHGGTPGGRSPARLPLVGLSTHSPEQAIRAVAAGAAYVAIGPVFSTPTKPSAQPVTLEYVRWAASNCTVPWFAIGGITLSNLDAVLAAGARRICVVSAILNAPDIRQACGVFKERLLSVIDPQQSDSA